ncbi:MAG: hypothetical protein HDS36_00650 [Bacteroides sp.]|nr:hypothetical protein [Bacteroides sp.]
MKKFFLMLAVALPMFFATSCGDDNDDEVVINYSMPLLTKNASDVLSISNNSISLTWYESQEDVLAAMKPFSYVLNTEASGNNSLAYTYDADGNYPIYVYSFTNYGLNASSITITVEQDEEIDVDKYLKDNGYKDVSKDEDDDFVYRSKDKLTLVHYGYDGNVTMIWVPNDGTRASNRDILNTHLNIVKSIVDQRNAQ